MAIWNGISALEFPLEYICLEILALEYGLKNSLGNSHITILKYTLELE